MLRRNRSESDCIRANFERDLPAPERRASARPIVVTQRTMLGRAALLVALCEAATGACAVPLGVGALALASLSACHSEPVTATPKRVVEAFIRRMQRVQGDPKAARAAYDLLCKDAQNNLAERAKRASAVAGREVAPEEMLAPSHFSLRFKPYRYRTRIDGDWAVVSVRGEEPGQRAEVRCVKQEGGWRVLLELPPLPPIEKRRQPAGG